MEWKGKKKMKRKEIGKERTKKDRKGKERGTDRKGQKGNGKERKEEGVCLHHSTAGPTSIAQTIPSQQPESADDEVMPVDRLQVQEPFFFVG